MTNKDILEIAFAEYGVKEIKGKVDNPQVLKYFDYIGFNGAKLKDETAWCSAFMNYVAKKVGLAFTGKLNARSWLKIGREVETPQQGDVTVLWRVDPNDWRGHVGIFIREANGWIYLLGGNQNNQVKITAYPKSRLLGYRRLTND